MILPSQIFVFFYVKTRLDAYPRPNRSFFKELIEWSAQFFILSFLLLLNYTHLGNFFSHLAFFFGQFIERKDR